MNKQERSETILRWAVFTSIAVVEALLLTKLLLESGDTRADLVAAIVLVAVLLLLSPRVFDLKSLAYGKFRADLQRQIEQANDKIDDMFLLSMSPKVMRQLEKLATDHFGKYYIGMVLPRELNYLENLGYIQYKGGAKGIDDVPKQGSELSQHIEVTDEGRRFLEFRRAAQATSAGESSS